MHIVTEGGSIPANPTADLRDLIAHSEWVSADLSLGRAVQILNQTLTAYVAVRDGERVVGVVSRHSVGLLFGGRYGFALFGDKPVTSKMEPDFLPLPHRPPQD